MAAPTSQKQDAKPVLKSGAKWPAITLHTPPILQPTRLFEGADACRDLQKYLVEAEELLQPETVEEEAEDAEVALHENSAQGESADEQQQLQGATDARTQSTAPDDKQQHPETAMHAEVEQCSGVVSTSHCWQNFRVRCAVFIADVIACMVLDVFRRDGVAIVISTDCGDCDIRVHLKFIPVLGL
jgi:hypothetical protein